MESADGGVSPMCEIWDRFSPLHTDSVYENLNLEDFQMSDCDSFQLVINEGCRGGFESLPGDQALQPDSGKEGEESPPTQTPASQADLRGSDIVGTGDDSRVLCGGSMGPDPECDRDAIDENLRDSGIQETEGLEDSIGTEGSEDPNPRGAMAPYNSEQGGVQKSVPSQRKKPKKRKLWTGDEKNYFEQLKREAENKGFRRGEPLWKFISQRFWAKHKIRVTPEECKNHGDTCKRRPGASQRKGPSNSRSNKHSLQKPNDTMDDRIKLVDQKKLCSETGGIVGHQSLGEGDGDEDVLGTKKSQPGIDYSGIVNSRIKESVQTLLPLCTIENQIKVLKSIISFVEVGNQVELRVKASEPRFLLDEGYHGKANWEDTVKTIVRTEIETAFRSFGIIGTLLRSAQLEDELRDIKEKNRIVQEEIQTLQAQPASSHLFKDTENAIHYDIPHNDTQIG